jgi:hypothetical protein
MCHNPYTDSSFFKLLLEYDQDTAARVKAKGCQECGGSLDQAHYKRKPRGIPAEIAEEFDTRLSFCCRKDGCRKRVTPPSTRFLGAHVYALLAIVLGSSSSEKLRSYVVLKFTISTKTLKRWQKFWMARFKNSGFWRTNQSNGRIWQATSDFIPDRLLAAFVDPEATQNPCGYFELVKFMSPFSE